MGFTLPESRDFGETGPSVLKASPQSFLPGCLGWALESGLALVMAAWVSPGTERSDARRCAKPMQENPHVQRCVLLPRVTVQ